MLSQALFFAGLVSAATFQVKVGSGGDLYEPSTVTAQVGDTVEFHFTGSLHDVVQSTVDAPCSPKDGGFFVPVQSKSSSVFTVNITSTDPQYFYCSVPNHCNTGMVGIINPGSGTTQSAFASAAKSASLKSPSGGSAVGGVLSDGTASSSASASSSGAASTSKASSSATAGSTISPSAGGSAATAIPAALALLAGAAAALI